MFDPAITLSEGTLVAGRFEIRRRLGAGASAVVYEAKASDGTLVALKVLALDEGEARERWQREVSAAARVLSPNVVPILDHGEDASLEFAFLAMPLFAGTTLEKVLDSKAPLDPETVVDLALQIGQGLSASHKQGVIHRDLKPSNVLLDAEKDGTIVARICDFGMAKVADAISKLTRTGVLLGTPMYMAPEQALDPRQADCRSDVWSLAVMTWQALAGSAPLNDCKGYQEWHERLVNSDVPPLQDVAPWVSGPLARIVHGALLRSPGARCPDAETFVRALRPLASNRPLVRERLCTVNSDARGRVARRETLPTTWSDVEGTSGVADTERLLGATIGDRYRVVRLLGAGGMGSVYEVVTAEGETFALKVIRRENDSVSAEALKRFVREARTAMAVDHPNVVKVSAAGTDTALNVPYIAMELLVGSDLGHLVSRLGPLEPSVAVRIIHEACLGLAAAHDAGMIHRDIKPANIFLNQSGDGSVQVKVCDFGIAKQEASLQEHSATVLTETGNMLGSPLYMSPEQAQNAKRADTRSDVWSMGVSLYETLVGRGPWHGVTTIGELMLCLYTKEPPQVSVVAPWVDPALGEVVHRALQRDPSLRFQTAGEMAQALERYLPEARLVTQDLRAVAREIQAQAPPPPIAIVGTPAASTSKRSSSRVAVGLGAAVALLSAGALTVSLVRSGSTSTPTSLHGDSASVARLAEPPPPIQASVRVHPESASVTIGGVQQAVDGGILLLTGRPGESVTVVASLGDASAETRVVITQEGRTLPESIELVPAAASARLQDPAASLTRPTDAGRLRGAPPGSVQPDTPTVKPKPTGPETPPEPSIKRSWP